MSKKSAQQQPAGIDGSDDLAFRLGFYIHDTSRLRKLLFDAHFKPAGVTRAQASVLSCLWSQDEITQSELARTPVWWSGAVMRATGARSGLS